MSDTSQNRLNPLPLKLLVASPDLQLIRTIQAGPEELGSPASAYADSLEAPAWVWDCAFDRFFLDTAMPQPVDFQLGCGRASSIWMVPAPSGLSGDLKLNHEYDLRLRKRRRNQ
jgi:hypothetical protein